MQDLGAHQAAFRLNGLADRTQLHRRFEIIDSRPLGIEDALSVRREPARHQNGCLTARTLRIKRDLLGDPIGLGLKSGVHRPHDNAIPHPCLTRLNG